jgi:hypothetical protein
MANLGSLKLNAMYSKDGHFKLENFKITTLDHEIGHGKHETFY